MDSTQAKLLHAAGEVFSEKGFEAATVREICRRADVQNIASVNYYFGDKERLYQAAVKQAFHGGDPDRVPPVWPDGTLPADKMRDFIGKVMLGLVGTDRPAWHFHLMARELAQPSHGGEAFVRDFAQPHFKTLLTILGEMKPDMPEVKKHLTAFSIIGQCVHHRCCRNINAMMVGEEEIRTYSAELLADHIVDFTLAALGQDVPFGETRHELDRVEDAHRGSQ